MERKAEEVGLLVNAGKTKYLKISANQQRRVPHDLEVGGKKFQGVRNFSYLGVEVNCENDMSLSVRKRVQAGNRAFYANVKLLRNSLLSRTSKLKIYKTLVRPVVAYGAETWTLSKKMEEELRIFERKILRKIYGPINEGGEWRIRTNDEINTLIYGEDLVRFVKSQRLRWLGHLERMDSERTARVVDRSSLTGRRRRGRPRKRWRDQVHEDLRIMGRRGWRDLAMDREKWRTIVLEAKAHPGL